MSRRSKKKINKKIQKTLPTPLLETPISGDFYTLCKDLLNKYPLATRNLDADTCFAIAVTSREENNHILTRQAVFNLLNFIDEEETAFIKRFIKYKDNLSFTNKLLFLKDSDFDNSVHPYLTIIKKFIESTTNQQMESYFNSFLGKSAKYSEELPKFEIKNLSIQVIIEFYEITHRILLDNISNKAKLRELTLFIFNTVQEQASQSLLFFMSYFIDDKIKKVHYANLFLKAKNYANNINYHQPLANNTAYAAADIEDFDEAEFWLDEVEDSERYEKIEAYIASKKEQIEEKLHHPLNPKNIAPLHIDVISTIDIIHLCSFLDSCGEDWGLKPLARYGRYIFPSYETTINNYKSLALKKIIKLSPSSFASFKLNELNEINHIIENQKFHINIIGVTDNKTLALTILLEEIARREDIAESALEVWKQITLDYFYSSLNYSLSNVRDSWADDFTLNEKTISNLSNASLSAQVLSYIARSASTYTAGQYATGHTTGNKHTCNTLISSINRQLEWIETGQFIAKTFPRNKQPILSSERIIEIITKITPDDLYNLIPNVDLIYFNKNNDGRDF